MFKKEVYRTVSNIPYGRVMSYGSIAACCGRPGVARQVGQIAHYGPEDLPWHRVVHKDGRLATGYWGGVNAHKQALEAEGVVVKEYKIRYAEYEYLPIEP